MGVHRLHECLGSVLGAHIMVCVCVCVCAGCADRDAARRLYFMYACGCAFAACVCCAPIVHLLGCVQVSQPSWCSRKNIDSACEASQRTVLGVSTALSPAPSLCSSSCDALEGTRWVSLIQLLLGSFPSG